MVAGFELIILAGYKEVNNKGANIKGSSLSYLYSTHEWTSIHTQDANCYPSILYWLFFICHLVISDPSLPSFVPREDDHHVDCAPGFLALWFLFSTSKR